MGLYASRVNKPLEYHENDSAPPRLWLSPTLGTWIDKMWKCR